jgi:hypothetical protein
MRYPLFVGMFLVFSQVISGSSGYALDRSATTTIASQRRAENPKHVFPIRIHCSDDRETSSFDR